MASILETTNLDLRVVLYSLLALLAGHYLLWTYLRWHKLRNFPGPPLASVSYLWLMRAALSGRAWQYQQDARRRYSARFHPNTAGKGSSTSNSGPFVRVAPDMLIHDSPSVHRQINSVRGGYTKGDWYAQMAFDPYVHSMFSTRDNAYHDDAKARTAHGYSGKEVPSLEADIDAQIVALKKLIREKYLSPAEDGETKPCDMARLAQYFTLDSLTKVAYGEEFGFLRTDADVHGYIKTVEDYGPLFTLCADVPWIGKILASNFMLKLVGPKPTDETGVGKMMGYVADRPGLMD